MNRLAVVKAFVIGYLTMNRLPVAKVFVIGYLTIAALDHESTPLNRAKAYRLLGCE